MAKNDPANVVAGAGLLMSIITNLNAEISDLGGVAGDLHRLTTPDGRKTIRLMARLIVDAGMQTDPQRLMRNFPIEELEFSVRTYNCLKRVEVETIGDLTSKTEDQLRNIPNFGERSIAEVIEVLGQHGLHLLDQT